MNEYQDLNDALRNASRPPPNPDDGTAGPADKTLLIEHKNSIGFSQALENLEISIRWNTRTKRHEAAGFYADDHCESSLRQPDGYYPIDDALAARLCEEIAGTCNVDAYTKEEPDKVTPWVITPQLFWQFCLALTSRESHHDPVVAWLDGLPEWDGVERVKDFLKIAFGDEGWQNSDTYLEAVAWHLFGPAVGRAYRHGVTADVVPVLVGMPGMGKSSVLAELLPPDWRELWFADNVSLTLPKKVLSEEIGSAWMTEFSEMQGAKHSDVERLKAMLSSKVDTFRLSYARVSRPFPRCWAGVGTANPDRPVLANDPNQRRFLSVQLPAVPKGESKVRYAAAVRARVDTVREQLWAEAVYRWHESEETPFWGEFLANAEEEQEQANDELRNRDPDVEDMADLIVEAGNEGKLIELVDAATEGIKRVRFAYNAHSARQLSIALRERGWTNKQRKLNGQVVKDWRPE